MAVIGALSGGIFTGAEGCVFGKDVYCFSSGSFSPVLGEIVFKFMPVGRVRSIREGRGAAPDADRAVPRMKRQNEAGLFPAAFSPYGGTFSNDGISGARALARGVLAESVGLVLGEAVGVRDASRKIFRTRSEIPL